MDRETRETLERYEQLIDARTETGEIGTTQVFRDALSSDRIRDKYPTVYEINRIAVELSVRRLDDSRETPDMGKWLDALAEPLPYRPMTIAKHAYRNTGETIDDLKADGMLRKLTPDETAIVAVFEESVRIATAMDADDDG